MNFATFRMLFSDEKFHNPRDMKISRNISHATKHALRISMTRFGHCVSRCIRKRWFETSGK